METKSAPWGDPQPEPRTMTQEIRFGSDRVVRFHRDAAGRVWMREFMWQNDPPGYWSAEEPHELTPQERRLLLDALNS